MKLERVREIAIDELQPFINHPFQVKNDEEMKSLCDSIGGSFVSVQKGWKIIFKRIYK